MNGDSSHCEDAILSEIVSAEEFEALETAVKLAEYRSKKRGATCKKRSSITSYFGGSRGEAEHVLRRIISGGQTGADMAGLRAGRQLGYETGGTAPANFATSAGRKEGTLKSFGLSALPLCKSRVASFVQRSKCNVDNSSATVAFRVRSSAGTDKTIGYCVERKWCKLSSLPLSKKGFCELTGYKPVLVISAFTPACALALGTFLVKHRVTVLNVAGHRSLHQNDPWEKQVFAFLLRAIPAAQKKRKVDK